MGTLRSWNTIINIELLTLGLQKPGRSQQSLPLSCCALYFLPGLFLPCFHYLVTVQKAAKFLALSITKIANWKGKYSAIKIKKKGKVLEQRLKITKYSALTSLRQVWTVTCTRVSRAGICTTETWTNLKLSENRDSSSQLEWF